MTWANISKPIICGLVDILCRQSKASYNQFFGLCRHIMLKLHNNGSFSIVWPLFNSTLMDAYFVPRHIKRLYIHCITMITVNTQVFHTLLRNINIGEGESFCYANKMWPDNAMKLTDCAHVSWQTYSPAQSFNFDFWQHTTIRNSVKYQQYFVVHCVEMQDRILKTNA